MALRQRYDTEEEIPEQLRNFYIEADEGVWVLDVEGGSDAEGSIRRLESTVRNLRAERRKAVEERDALREKAREIERQLADRPESPDGDDPPQGGRPNDLQRQIDRAVERAERRLKGQIEEARETLASEQERYNALRQQHAEVVINNALNHAALEQGADPQKLRFLIKDAKDVWRLGEDHQPLPYERNDVGEEEVIYGNDGKPMTMQQQVRDILKENPWLRLESNGSNAMQHQGSRAHGNVVLTRAQARDVRAYESAKQRAESQGVDLVIEG